MIYIDGLGQFNNQIKTISNSTNSISNSFDDILVREQEKLSSDNDEVNLEAIFEEASNTYNVSIDLLKAVAYQESGFQADATSYVGAMGIMQLMPSTASSLGVTDAYDPYQNIMGGAKLLSRLQDMYDGDIPLMLAGYNAGSGNVEKYGGVPPFEETQNYVKNIVSILNGQTKVDVPSNTKDPEVIVVTDSMVSQDVTFPNGTPPKTANEAYYESVQDLLKSINTSAYKHYNTSDINSIYSYSEYELLIKYFDHMMEIISNIGKYDSDSSDDSGLFSRSLYNYELNNTLYNKNNIKFF